MLAPQCGGILITLPRWSSRFSRCMTSISLIAGDKPMELDHHMYNVCMTSFWPSLLFLFCRRNKVLRLDTYIEHSISKKDQNINCNETDISRICSTANIYNESINSSNSDWVHIMYYQLEKNNFNISQIFLLNIWLSGS